MVGREAAITMESNVSTGENAITDSILPNSRLLLGDEALGNFSIHLVDFRRNDEAYDDLFMDFVDINHINELEPEENFVEGNEGQGQTGENVADIEDWQIEILPIIFAEGEEQSEYLSSGNIFEEIESDIEANQMSNLNEPNEEINFSKMLMRFDNDKFFEIITTLIPRHNNRTFLTIEDEEVDLEEITFRDFLRETNLQNSATRHKSVITEKEKKVNFENYVIQGRGLSHTYDVDSAIWIGNSVPDSEFLNFVYFPFPDLRKQLFKDSFLNVKIGRRTYPLSSLPNIQIGSFGVGGENRLFLFLPSLNNEPIRGVSKEAVKTFYDEVSKPALFEVCRALDNFYVQGLIPATYE